MSGVVGSRPAGMHCVVSGRVQGVGFRYFVVDQAEALRLRGWVRNRADGRSVEVMATGNPAQLERLREALRRGPRGAIVDRVECAWVEPEQGHEGFVIRR